MLPIPRFVGHRRPAIQRMDWGARRKTAEERCWTAWRTTLTPWEWTAKATGWKTASRSVGQNRAG